MAKDLLTKSQRKIYKAGIAMDAFCDAMIANCDDDPDVKCREGLLIGAIALTMLRFTHKITCGAVGVDHDELWVEAENLLDTVNTINEGGDDASTH